MKRFYLGEKTENFQNKFSRFYFFRNFHDFIPRFYCTYQLNLFLLIQQFDERQLGGNVGQLGINFINVKSSQFSFVQVGGFAYFLLRFFFSELGSFRGRDF
eukprot:TRINITY_DN687_c0_g1_i8.p1 TRINITY_DN687_c0_g1~~TRINITY_DN687_c0_g1_i8.p1  ORF type:complete len:101 (+),score=15.21 TRINITY_DN687_c0_g1_i8:146-448(+)